MWSHQCHHNWPLTGFWGYLDPTEGSSVSHKHHGPLRELGHLEKKWIFATSKQHHNIMTHFIASTGTVNRPGDNPAWPSGLSDGGAMKSKAPPVASFSLSSLVICSVCSTNFPVLQAYRDQHGELCPTLTYLMDLVTMPQSSGLTDPITPPPSFRREIAPSNPCRRTPHASPRV